MLIDVSHTVENGMITYKGLPAPLVCDYMSREASKSHYGPGTEFQIGKIEMVANTGTYLDAPFHRFADGKDLSQLPLTSLANLDGIVIRVPQVKEIGPELLINKKLRGKAVLFDTQWSRHWRTDQYFEGHPYLTKAAAQYLADQGVKLVGIDSLNIDSTENPHRPVHTTLLHQEIPIVEHLTNLNSLPDEGFSFFAVPIKIRSFGSFPTRAFGLIP